MLILTRKTGESLRIGDDIILTVTGVAGPQVRLGIDAPQDVEILREELAQRESTHSATDERPGDTSGDQRTRTQRR